MVTDKESVDIFVYRSFKEWWNEDNFDWKRNSIYLAIYYDEYFDDWWNPNKFDWKSGSRALAEQCSNHFRKWWNPDKFDWESGCISLTLYCRKYFNRWWNSDKFDWKRGSGLLPRYYSVHFKKWWDPDRFNWENSHLLAIYCSKNRDTWWYPERFQVKLESFIELIEDCKNECLIPFIESLNPRVVAEYILQSSHLYNKTLQQLPNSVLIPIIKEMYYIDRHKTSQLISNLEISENMKLIHVLIS